MSGIEGSGAEREAPVFRPERMSRLSAKAPGDDENLYTRETMIEVVAAAAMAVQ